MRRLPRRRRAAGRGAQSAQTEYAELRKVTGRRAVTAIGRFVEAQDAGQEFEAALAEIRAGEKHGHWIWYVFPQLAGLGRSRVSQLYAIRDWDEAAEYLRHPVLFSRLGTITTAVADQVARGVRVDRLMGSPVDAQKLVSSLTLFAHVARALQTDDDGRAHDVFAGTAESILAAAASQGYAACRHTLTYLDSLTRHGERVRGGEGG